MWFYNQEKVLQSWEKFLQEERSLARRLIVALFIAGIGLALDEAAYLLTERYFSALPVATAAFIALYSGYRLALVAGVVLALIADYYFLPPIGSVLDSAVGYIHLSTIIILTTLICLIITALRQAFSRMRQAREAAEQSKLEMEQVLSVVSHDLRNPISVARAGAEALLVLRLEPEQSKKIERGVIEAMDRADSMIRELLDRHQTHKGQRQQNILNLNRLVEKLIQEFRLLHGNRFELLSQAEVQGPWSAQDLRRVIENLVGNAVKYGAPDKKITLKIDQDAQQAVISVHNFGEPISAERQERLFKRSQPVERLENLKQEGWGIGLMSVSRIVEAYHGHVAVESSKEQGTLFTIWLPKQNL